MKDFMKKDVLLKLLADIFIEYLEYTKNVLDLNKYATPLCFKQ